MENTRCALLVPYRNVMALTPASLLRRASLAAES